MTEAYAVDEAVELDPTSSKAHHGPISPALRKAMDIGALCNNASLVRNQEGIFVGQSTDVALLNILELHGVPDRRAVRSPASVPHPNAD